MLSIELLAPAGSPESLEAAIAAGADAVYLGVERFGARQFATNFESGNLQGAVQRAHNHNVAIYVTMNTLIKEEEFDEALAIVDTLYRADVDALILQDLGLARVVAERYPDFERHASTQMTAQSLEDVLFLEKMGFSRVVVAREMSIEELRAIRDKTTVPLEIFVHGALCTAYSGACLMSAYIGGRSGNRGACAQPCRLAYTAIDGEGIKRGRTHYLSQKDLNVLDHLGELKSLAPVSFKIEGRMKSPAYVAGVVETYRRAIDGQVVAGAKEALARLFNRGFTTGHLFKDHEMGAHDLPGHRGVPIGRVEDEREGYLYVRLSGDLAAQDDIQVSTTGGRRVGGRVERLFMSGEPVEEGASGDLVKFPFKHAVPRGADVFKTFDVRLNDRLALRVHEGRRSIPVSGQFILEDQGPPVLTLTDGKGTVTVVADQEAQPARKAPLTEEKVREQLIKMGDTPYALLQLEIRLVPDRFLPVSELNALRRKAVEALAALRMQWHPERAERQGLEPLETVKPTRIQASPRAVVQVRTAEQLDVVRRFDVHAIYTELDGPIAEDGRIFRIGRFTGRADQRALVARTLGDLEHASVADFTLNVFNRQTVTFLSDRGMDVVTASPELSLDEIRNLHVPGVEIELIVYGRLPLMTIRDRGAMRQEGVVALEDERGDRYPYVDLDEEHHQVFAPEPIHLEPKDFTGTCHRYRIILTDESAERTEAVLSAYLRECAYPETPESRGAFYSGVR